MAIKTFVFFDLESTGLPKEERNRTKITELCFIAVSRYDIIDTKHGLLPSCRKLSLLFNPERDVHPIAARMTGLTRAYLKAFPTFKKNANAIYDFLDELETPVCLVAHNGYVFDFKLLTTEFKNVGKHLPPGLLCIDSLPGFRRILGENPIDYKSFSSLTVNDILTDDEDDDFPELNISKEDWNELDKLSESLTNVSIASSSSGTKSINTSKGSLGKSTPESKAKSQPGSFVLTTLYKRLLNKEPKNAHQAEADCIMLMECVIALKDQFLPWADGSCKRINTVKPFVPF